MALSFATQNALPPEYGEKWGAKCPNTRLPLPTTCEIHREVEKKYNYILIIYFKTFCIQDYTHTSRCLRAQLLSLHYSHDANLKAHLRELFYNEK